MRIPALRFGSHQSRPGERRGRWLALALCAALLTPLLGACSPVLLVARDGSSQMVGQDSEAKLELTLTANAWQGDPRVPENFTVLHVTITNLSGRSLRIAPGDFELRDQRGNLYAIQNVGSRFSQEVRRADAEEDEAPVTVSPLPDHDQLDAGYPVERIYSADETMNEEALAWGSLAADSRIHGFLYFEPVTPTANLTRLIWHGHDAQGHALAKIGFELHTAELRATRG